VRSLTALGPKKLRAKLVERHPELPLKDQFVLRQAVCRELYEPDRVVTELTGWIGDRFEPAGEGAAGSKSLTQKLQRV